MLRSTRIVLLLSLAVQIAAFVRTAVIAATLGASPEVDAYNLGLVAPIFLSTVIGSWLQMSFVGRYTSLVATGENDLAVAYRSRMLVLVLAMGLLFACLCFLLPHQIMGLFLPSDPVTLNSAAAALKLSGLILIPILLSDFIALILNSHGRFLEAALAPLINALTSVVGLLFWPSSLDLSALIWTLLLGSIVQTLAVAAALLRLRIGFLLQTSIAKSEVLTTLALAVPLVPAMMLSNSTVAIVQFRAAEFGEGVVAAYGYAFRFHNALAQVLVIGLSTVLLPHFAALWSRGEQAEIIVLIRRLARFTVMVVPYLTIGIFLMGETATKVFLQRGAFVAGNTELVSWFWAILSLSLFQFAFGTFIAKFGQALRDSGSVLMSSLIAFSLTWIVTWLGQSFKSIDLVVGATAVGILGATSFWLIWLAKRISIGPILKDLFGGLIRIGLILVPAIIAERSVHLHLNGVADQYNLLIRGSLYSIVAISILLVTRAHVWFLSRRPA